jgi:hypothetical protein
VSPSPKQHRYHGHGVTEIGDVLPLLLALMTATVAADARATETVKLAELKQHTHIHGLTVDPKDPSRLYLATHHGLLVVTPNSLATRVSERSDDFMGFVSHPTDPERLYASGHPAGGGNLGSIMSSDRGRTWQLLSTGQKGPVDFHQMDVSKADPNVIYGVFGGLQRSRDGGRTWKMVGDVPERLIDIAASAKDVDRVYAATERGLLITLDAGKTWQSAYMYQQPVTMVHITPGSDIYAFVLGIGLIRGVEPNLRWKTLSREFGDQFILHFAIDPTNGNKLYAATGKGDIIASNDGGRTWAPFGTPFK